MIKVHILIYGECGPSLELWQYCLKRLCERVTLCRRIEQTTSVLDDDVSALLLVIGGADLNDGLRSLRRLRKRLEVPILVIADIMSSAHAVRFLDAGADDFLASDTDLKELVAKVRCKCRRSDRPANRVISAGGFTIDMTTMEVRWQGRQIPTSYKGLLILIELASQPDRVLTISQLEQILYGAGFYAKSNTIQVFVHELRKMTHRDAIVTVRGVGYCLGPRPA